MAQQTTKEFKTQAEIYEHALSLYEEKNREALEALFTKYLRKSYDFGLWCLYIKYIKRMSKIKANFSTIYEFVFKNMEKSYFVCGIVRDYIAELETVEDETRRTESIRGVYRRALISPKEGISQLWMEYEKWEEMVSKGAARGFISQIQPAYNIAAAAYQRLAPYIKNDDYFKIFDIELENPLKLSKPEFDARLGFIFDFYMARLPGQEAIPFLKTLYFRETAKFEAPETFFLRAWYSFISKRSFFNLETDNLPELEYINYLNWVIKNEGMESFRVRFEELKERVGPHAFVFAANAEFYQSGRKEAAYRIMQEAETRFPDSSLICEEFLKIFLRIGDDDNIRGLFKKLRKTAKMWDLMLEYEFMHGDAGQYAEFLMMKQEALRRKEILPMAPVPVAVMPAEGCQGVYETVRGNFGFLDLQIPRKNFLETFIHGLPILSPRENILVNFDSMAVIELLRSIQ